ncbi:LCP family protein [Dethiobacter alkaliphilus]|uniref:LCP family protein n=1 Tax=Dethiobacter alkaliphilus TaxID=427926 RepID=UPI002227EC56|nr:LCP family protein [Dethiobacter alkaliphilus]MCW3489029.1 LCP family protein [Dethiobacter alkaliphilus]
MVTVVILSLVFLGAYGYFGQMNQPEKEQRIESYDPLTGYWSKIEDGGIVAEIPLSERQDNRVPPIEEEPARVQEETPEEVNRKNTQESPVVPQNNKKLNNTNVIFIWTDGQNLKAVNVMSINEESKKGVVVAVPLLAKIEQNSFLRIEEGRAYTTVGQVFYVKGKAGFISLIEERMGIEIDSYVLIDQSSFEKISDIMGDIDIQGEMVSIADAFEQTRTGERTDEQPVVDAVVKAVICPSTLIKIPQVIWVLTREVDTNLGREQIMAIYRQTRNTTNIQKRALPGKEYITDGKKLRNVPEYAWKNIFWNLTN